MDILSYILAKKRLEDHNVDVAAHADIRTQINHLDALHEVGYFSRDLSLTGTQKIATSKKPKSIILQSVVTQAVGKKSWGLVSRTKNYCLLDFNNSTANTFANNLNYSIAILNTSANRTFGAVTLFEDDGFTITWSHLGTGATGTADITYMAIY